MEIKSDANADISITTCRGISSSIKQNSWQKSDIKMCFVFNYEKVSEMKWDMPINSIAGLKKIIHTKQRPKCGRSCILEIPQPDQIIIWTKKEGVGFTFSEFLFYFVFIYIIYMCVCVCVCVCVYTACLLSTVVNVYNSKPV